MDGLPPGGAFDEVQHPSIFHLRRAARNGIRGRFLVMSYPTFRYAPPRFG
jgi:hypothetical protein